MIERRTTLIIGAGASAECGLPTGAKLKERISSLLNIQFEHGIRQKTGDYAICEALRVAVANAMPPGRDINPHLHAAWRIRDAMPQAISIDNFIDTHQGNSQLELCGKLAIVRAILDAERQSKIYFDPHGNKRALHFDSLGATWYTRFFQLLTENCTADQLEERFSRISLIIFNYDRCIEHFLYHALQNYYGISAEQAGNLINRLGIFHPYGKVGPLIWQNQGEPVDFGAETDARKLLKLASQIRTFTEGTDPTHSEVEEIRASVTGAQIVIFLGFAFHRLNLQLIWSDGFLHESPDGAKFFGTALGLSQNDCDEITNELANLSRAPIQRILIRNTLTCEKLFEEYWRSLSLARFRS